MKKESVGPLLRIKSVEQMVGLKKTAIYDRIKKGAFPPPIKLGSRTSAWSSALISDWIEKQMNRTAQ